MHQKKWLGVKATASVESALTLVNGLLFTLFSISQNIVCILSSVSARSLYKQVNKTLRMVRIIRSNAPDCWLAKGRETFQSTS